MTRILSWIEAHIAEQPPIPQNQEAPRWYMIDSGTDTSAVDVLIYDEITDPLMAEWGIGISALQFRRDLQPFAGRDLNVHINSPGGNVFDGLAIYNTLRQHDGKVTVIVDGIAASIASVIAMAGDEIIMAPSAMMMIHDASAVTYGDQAAHLRASEVLDKISADIAGVYKARGDSRINWRDRMRKETWLTSDEAVSIGLADRVDDALHSAVVDRSIIKLQPKSLFGPDDEDVEAQDVVTVRAAERALRDAGLSRRQAAAVLASGWTSIDRDDQEDEPNAPAPDPSGSEVETFLRRKHLMLLEHAV